MKASGTDVAMNGQSNDHFVQPARQKRQVASVATTRFNASAVGRMVTGAMPISAMIARYPDAPAWPTLL